MGGKKDAGHKTQDAGKKEWEKGRVGEREKGGKKTQDAGRKTQGRRQKAEGDGQGLGLKGSPPCLSAVAEAKAERGQGWVRKA